MSPKRFTDGILDTIETVAVSPDGYPHVPDAELSRQGYRMTLYKKYVCVYRVIDETVFVYHVADGRSDYGQLIRKLL